MGRVIAFANQKGGVAKTTSTLNLARRVRGEGPPACSRVDLDPQGNLTMSQGLNPDTIERSMYDVLVHKLPIEQVVASAARSTSPSPRSTSPAPSSRCRSMIGRERALEKALQPVRDNYDYIVHRHAAVARPADDQRARRVQRGDRAGPVRVPLAARARPAREHAHHDPREPEPARRRSRGSCRRCTTAGRCTRARRSRSCEENFGDLVFKTRIRKTIRYAEAPVKGTSRAQVRPDRQLPPRRTATWRRRCSMARKRASMREGPLAELFRATEAAQRQAEGQESEARGAGAAACARGRAAARRPSCRLPPVRRLQRLRPHLRPAPHRRRSVEIRPAGRATSRRASRAVAEQPSRRQAPRRPAVPRRAVPGPAAEERPASALGRAAPRGRRRGCTTRRAPTLPPTSP